MTEINSTNIIDKIVRSDKPIVSIIIPTWNGKHLLNTCLESLKNIDSIVVIIVDDKSDDDTVLWLAEAYPSATVIRQPVRRGFAAAVNAGIRACNTPYIALLNNDAVAEPEWIVASVRALTSMPTYAVCVPKIVYTDHQSTINSVGVYLKWYGASGDIGIGEPDDGRFSSYAEVFGFTGCAVVFRREVFVKVGLFDEWLEAYGEDLDWTLRARKQGLRFIFCPDARVRHRGGATFGRRSQRAVFLQSRNSVVVLAKHLPMSSFVRNAPGLVAFNIYQVMVNVLRRRGYAALLGKVHGLWHAWARRHTYRASAEVRNEMGGCDDPLRTVLPFRPIELPTIKYRAEGHG